LLRALTARLANLDYEILIVDDDSPDQTWRVAAEMAESHARLRVIRRTEGRGLAASVIEGFNHASGKFVACMDGDLQHDPEVLATMLTGLRQGAGVVVASRYVASGATGSWSPGRKLESRIAIKLAQWLVGVNLQDPMSGFFMMRRADFLSIKDRLQAQGFKVLLEIMANLDSKAVVEVAYTFRPRTAGSSKLSQRVILAYLIQLLRLSKAARMPRFVKFGLVGAIGTVVNLASMSLIMGILGWRDWRASSLATFIATINNYLLNNAWTFRDYNHDGRRLVRGYALFLATSLAGLSVTILTYTAVTAALVHRGVPLSLITLLLVQMLAILCGFGVNYSFSRRVTWQIAGN
jgi:dolichol-phosphate mannosyltransferase